jgi:hypothetical protein
MRDCQAPAHTGHWHTFISVGWNISWTQPTHWTDRSETRSYSPPRGHRWSYTPESPTNVGLSFRVNFPSQLAFVEVSHVADILGDSPAAVVVKADVICLQ